jgi:hypothetical protein
LKIFLNKKIFFIPYKEPLKKMAYSILEIPGKHPRRVFVDTNMLKALQSEKWYVSGHSIYRRVAGTKEQIGLKHEILQVEDSIYFLNKDQNDYRTCNLATKREIRAGAKAPPVISENSSDSEPEPRVEEPVPREEPATPEARVEEPVTPEARVEEPVTTPKTRRNIKPAAPRTPKVHFEDWLSQFEVGAGTGTIRNVQGKWSVNLTINGVDVNLSTFETAQSMGKAIDALWEVMGSSSH